MDNQRRRDLGIALLLCVPITLAFVLVGDVLYMGWWYYLLALGLPILLALLFKPCAYFLSGVSLSANLCLWSYWALRYWLHDSLLALWHFSAMPLWALGWLGALFVQHHYIKTAAGAFWTGCLYPTVGFFIMQLIFFKPVIFR